MRSSENRVGRWFVRTFRPQEVARRTSRNRLRIAANWMAKENRRLYTHHDNWTTHGWAHDELCRAAESDYAAHGARMEFTPDHPGGATRQEAS